MSPVRPILSKSTGPIFAKFSGSVKLRLQLISLKLIFDLWRDAAMATIFALVSLDAGGWWHSQAG